MDATLLKVWQISAMLFKSIENTCNTVVHFPKGIANTCKRIFNTFAIEFDSKIYIPIFNNKQDPIEILSISKSTHTFSVMQAVHRTPITSYGTCLH